MGSGAGGVVGARSVQLGGNHSGRRGGGGGGGGNLSYFFSKSNGHTVQRCREPFNLPQVIDKLKTLPQVTEKLRTYLKSSKR